MPKHMTNEQLVKRMMSVSPFGALAQVFIIEAIRRYAESVKGATAEDLAGMDSGLISADAWKAVAEDIYRQMSVCYGWKE